MPFLINIIIGLVLSFASTLLQQAFAPKPQEQARRTGTRGSAQIGGKVPQYFLVGTVGEPGKLEYQNAWGNDGEVPNAYLTSVYSFGDLPVSDMVGLFVNGVRVTLTESGAVAQGYPITLTGDNGTRRLWWKFFDGSQTTADSYLVDKFGGDADRAWTSDMVGVGVPYLITTALWSETLWTGFPSFMGEFQGIPLYDPRLDTTAGGSGSQRWDDPSTWAFSDNNMVMIYNIERGIYYDGARVWGGSATEAQLPYDVWSAAMDACDALVAKKGGGTEKQFRGGRRINLNERPADVIKELLIGANSRISHASDGTIYVLVGVPDEADGAFSDADVLATEPLGSIPFPNLDSIINGATATYREPSQAWEDKETAPYYRSDLETEDDGRQQLEGLDLGTTFSGTQAQRVIKAVIEEGRRFKTHVVALPPEFAQFRPLQVLAWTSDRFDYTAKLFLITARTRAPWGQVVFGLQEIDPADHDWDPETDEQPLSFAPVVTNRPPPQEVTGFSLSPVTEIDSNGNDRRVGYDAFWSAPSVAVDVQFVRISHRLVGGTLPIWVGLIPLPNLLLGEGRVTEGTVPGEIHEVEIQYLAASGRETISSGWLEVAVPSLPEAVDIGVAQLGQELQNAHGLVTGDSPGAIQTQLALLKQREQELALAVMDFNATAKETLNVLSVQKDGAVAAVIRNERAIVEEGVARAEAITELTASIGNFIAGGFLRFDVEVDELGSTASIMAKVQATAGADFSTAAWILKAEADGLGGTTPYFGVLGTMHVFDAEDGSPIPVFSATADGIEFTNGIFAGTFQSKAKVSGTPRFLFNGDTGFWTLGV
jgi:hypothetical protein